MKNNLKPGGIILLCMVLAACTSVPAVSEKSRQDIFEIEKLAISTYENAQWAKSEEYYRELVERTPEESMNWFRLGNIYARTNRPDAAILAYREALLRDNEFSRAWYNMGIIQLQQAAHSFNEMHFYVDSADPLHIHSQRLLEGILRLIGEDDRE